MRTTILLLLLLATPAFAQVNTLTFFATGQHNGGDTPFAGDPGESLMVHFENGRGFGASYARAIRDRWSIEAAVFRTTSDVRIFERTAGSFDAGELDLTSLIGMIRAHTHRDGPFDVWAGAGVAHVIASDVSDVPVDNESTLAIGAGVAWDFSPRAGITLDARYLPLTLTGQTDNGDVEADINPLLVSIGLRFRF
jgi:outer membrane protein W